MKSWRTSELRWIKENIHLTDKQIGEHFNVNASAISATRKRHGIMKGKEAGRFKKGQEPHNKGKKMDPEVYKKVKATMFKKGHKPSNYRKIGETFDIPDSTGKVYRFIKLPHNRQYPYARYIYEKHTGEKLSKNDVIRFKDKNTLNCQIDNLEKASRADHALLNANRPKAAQSLKKHWRKCHAYEAYGIKTSRHEQIKKHY